MASPIPQAYPAFDLSADRTTREIDGARVTGFYETFGNPNSGIRKSAIDYESFRIIVKGPVSDEQAQKIKNLVFSGRLCRDEIRWVIPATSFLEPDAMIEHLERNVKIVLSRGLK